ncbi:uncharacterized protein LOC125447241 isoform X2 [Stegostoma tigrinum]|uniref:uncharacterized protein LOC125447241 isoform X2 n=1 Tax=Stegostoma tigrinum TaxID=3053191 RepID=UPI00202BA003|nr:uncharacterized protein LOC125447241 isoform X2 [Stegostoma tigrinum]
MKRSFLTQKCAIFLERVEKNKNAANSLREYSRKLEGKHKKLENLLNKLESDRRGTLYNSLFLEKSNKQKHTFEVENSALQQRSLVVEKSNRQKHTFEAENNALQQRSLAFEKSNKQKHTFEVENSALQQRSLAFEKSNKQKHTFEVENSALQQRSLAVEKNLCEKTTKDSAQWCDNVRRESKVGLAATSEKRAEKPSSAGNPQLQILEQIARSMSDLRQVLTSQLNEIKEKSNIPGTSSSLRDKEPSISPVLLESVRESLDNVVGKYQSKTAHQRAKLKMLTQFDGKFEAFNQQWERTQKEHQRTTQMIQELKTEIDSIANTSKRMFSAFDQIEENVHNLGHIKPLIENIQKLLERRKKQQSIEERYISSVNQRSMQGEVLQHMVDQAVLPLVERIRMCHYPFICNECSGNCKHKMVMH